MQALALAAPLTVFGRAWAAPQNGGAHLLLVFLRGGYDAANVVIPVSSDFYYEARPSLAIAKPDPANPASALPLDADWGLHPALKNSLYPLWQKGQLAFAPFAGTDDLTRSHFETQDTIELGQPVGGSRNYSSGFMNRLAGRLKGGRPIAFTDQLPLTFRGSGAVPNQSIASVAKPGVDARQAALIDEMYQATPLAGSVKEGFAVRDQVYNTISVEMAAANRGAVSPKGFELSARRIGRLMQSDFNLAFVDVGGWDTHVNEGGATGYLPGRLGELGRGLAGFADEIGQEAWSQTAVIVISEFGRTFRENGDKGADHGHGSVYWVLGGAVKGGRLAGAQVKVERATLNQDRDLPVLTDYRALIGGVAQRLYGLSPSDLSVVFPNAEPRDLQLV
jgi:uncharacterized protein (DUF1501 family)